MDTHWKCLNEMLLMSSTKVHVWIQRGGGQGVPYPPPPQKKKNHKNIGFLGNSGPDPLKNHKATEPAFNVGQSLARQQNVI